MVKQTNVRSSKKFPVVSIIVILAITALAIFGGYYFFKYQDVSKKYTEASLTTDERNRNTVEQVAKLYKVPSFEDEKPTIYEVTDPEEIKNNEFFKDAETSDQVIIYKESDIAILYRPSEYKIINTGAYTTSFAGKVEVAIIATESDQKKLEEVLTSKYGNIAVVSKSSPKGTVAKGIAVDVSGKEADAAKKLADLLGYEVGGLPAGEKAPDGAKLIIIGPSTE